MSKLVKRLTTATFDAEVTARPGLALVDFGAVWCGPCRVLEPIVEALAAEHAGALTVAKVDVDEHPELAARFDVRALPTLLLFRDGKVVDALYGAMPRARITARLAPYMSAGSPSPDGAAPPRDLA